MTHLPTLSSLCQRADASIEQLAQKTRLRRQYQELRNEMEQVRATYTLMLRFLVAGQQDSEAERIHEQLCERAAIANERASWLFWHEWAADVPINFIGTDMGSRFDLISMSNVWTAGQTDSALSWLREHQHTDGGEACLLLSAVTLSLIQLFDAGKLMLLLEAYDMNAALRSRALVGIVLTLHSYGRRYRLSRACRTRLDWLFGQEQFCHRLYVVLRQLEHSRHTPGISDKISQDIMPAILSGGKFKRLRMELDDAQQALTEHGENIEWFLPTDADATAQDKMRQMTEMQLEGADIYMHTLSQLRKRLPAFFKETANWFRPFSFDEPFVARILQQCTEEEARAFRLIIAAAPFCDSDKYAFAGMFDMVGSTGRQALLASLGSQLDGENMEEVLADQAAEQRGEEVLTRHCIWDLYRYMKLCDFSSHALFDDDEEDAPFSPLRSQAFVPLLTHAADLHTLAEFFMRQGVYDEALEMFVCLQGQHSEPTATLWQEIAFCELRLDRHEEAFEHLTLAFAIQPDSQWTLRHLVAAAIETKRYVEGDTYCDLLLEQEPDSLRWLRDKGLCLMRLQRYDEALPIFFKLAYLGDDKPDTALMRVRCLLMTGQTDKAREQAQELLTERPHDTDALFLLAATYLVEHDLQTVYDLLRPAWLALTNDGERQLFVQDFQEMTALAEGKDTLFGMLLDAIRQGTE